jgi:hypothetical protein
MMLIPLDKKKIKKLAIRGRIIFPRESISHCKINWGQIVHETFLSH